jgi:hypothetical protein
MGTTYRSIVRHLQFELSEIGPIELSDAKMLSSRTTYSFNCLSTRQIGK